MDSQTCCLEKHANLISAEVQVINTRSFAFYLTSSELSYALYILYKCGLDWFYSPNKPAKQLQLLFLFYRCVFFYFIIILSEESSLWWIIRSEPEVVCHHRTRLYCLSQVWLCRPEVRHEERTLFLLFRISPQLALGQFYSSLPISPISASDT